MPLCWLLGLELHWGLTGIWIAMMSEEWLRGLLMAWRWKKRHWLKYAERSRAQVAPKMIPVAEEW